MNLPIDTAEQLERLRKLRDGRGDGTALADGGVPTEKLAPGAVTPAKLDPTGIKFLVGAGSNGAGAVALAGAEVGDRVVGVFGTPTAGGALTAPADGAFEPEVTVADEVRQRSASNLSGSTYVFVLIPAAA